MPIMGYCRGGGSAIVRRNLRYLRGLCRFRGSRKFFLECLLTAGIDGIDSKLRCGSLSFCKRGVGLDLRSVGVGKKPKVRRLLS